MSTPTNQLPFTQEPETAPPTMLPGFEGIRRYWDKYHQCYAVKVLPGEYYVTTHDELIVTTLGSCISACIRDRVFHIGGMNHFMLPNQTIASDNVDKSRISLANRYGGFAMENLINDILKNGGKRDNLEIKVFGGGKIINKMMDIGKRNITFIEEYIITEGLNLLAKDVGSVFPRKLMYNPISGLAKVKKLRSLQNNTIVERENRYLQTIDKKPLSGNIEIFD